MLRLRVGETTSAGRIASRINTLYGTGLFEKATFQITPVQGGKQVTVHTERGTDHRIRLGLHFDTESDGELLVNGLFKNILGKWSRLEITAHLGPNYSLDASLLFDSAAIPWFQAGTSVRLEHREFTLYENDLIADGLNYDYGELSLFIQSLNNRYFQYKIAVKKEFARISPRTTSTNITEQTHDFFVLEETIQVDTLDRADFPNNGILFTSTGSLISSVLSYEPGDIDKTIFRIMNNLYFYFSPFRGLTLTGNFTLNGIDGKNIPYDYLFYYGGLAQIRGMIFSVPGHTDPLGGGQKRFFHYNRDTGGTGAQSIPGSTRGAP